MPCSSSLKGVALLLRDPVTWAPSLVCPCCHPPTPPRLPPEGSPVSRILFTSGLREGRVLPLAQFATFYLLKPHLILLASLWQTQVQPSLCPPGLCPGRLSPSSFIFFIVVDRIVDVSHFLPFCTPLPKPLHPGPSSCYCLCP